MLRGGACVGDELFRRFRTPIVDHCAKKVQDFVGHLLVLIDEEHEPGLLIRNLI